MRLPLTLLSATTLLLASASASASPILVAAEDAGGCYHAHSDEVTAAGGVVRWSRLFTPPEAGQMQVILPIHAGGPEDHQLSVDDLPIELELLDTDEGTALLATLAKQRETPELLAAAGTPLLVGTIEVAARNRPYALTGFAPIQKTVDGGLVSVTLGTRTYGTTCLPVTTSVRATLEADDPIGAVFTPYHHRLVDRLDLRRVNVSISECPKQHDVEIMLATADVAVAAQALTYRKPSCEGLDASPPPGYVLLSAGATQTEATAAVAKDVVLVIDTSGSMQGDKLQQVKIAVHNILANLNPDDRFELVHFSTEAHATFGELVPKSAARLFNSAEAAVDALEANGSTNIDHALELAANALNAAIGDRPKMVLFLTDGAATAGETAPLAIVENFLERDEVGSRVFSFGVGDNVNTRLLDEVARQTGGETIYIRPGADIEATLTGFYEQVSAPVATDLALLSTGIHVTDRYPASLPDLYVGSDLAALGRYQDAPAASLGLSAETQDGLTSFAVGGAIARSDTRHGFLPRLWASRQLGQLLYEARENNSAPETVAAIRELALEHGFVTRFTPFVVDEDGMVDLEYQAPTNDDVGSEAVSRSGYTNELSGNSNAGAYSHTDAPIVSIHDRTFFRDQGTWVDTRIRGLVARGLEADPLLIHFGSEQWQALAAGSNEARRVLSVGRALRFELGCHLVEVVDPAGDAPVRSEDPLPAELIGDATPEVATVLPPPVAAKPQLPEVASGCSTGLRTPDGALLWFSVFASVLAVQRRRRR